MIVCLVRVLMPERALVVDKSGLFRDVGSPVPEPLHSPASGRKTESVSALRGRGRPVGSGYKQAIKNAVVDIQGRRVPPFDGAAPDPPICTITAQGGGFDVFGTDSLFMAECPPWTRCPRCNSQCPS